MAVKISDLPSVDKLDYTDTFLIIDRDEDGRISSKQLTFDKLISNIDDYGVVNYDAVSMSITNLESHLENLLSVNYAAISNRIDEIVQQNLHAGLSTGLLYVENLSAGVPQ